MSRIQTQYPIQYYYNRQTHLRGVHRQVQSTTATIRPIHSYIIRTSGHLLDVRLNKENTKETEVFGRARLRLNQSINVLAITNQSIRDLRILILLSTPPSHSRSCASSSDNSD